MKLAICLSKDRRRAGEIVERMLSAQALLDFHTTARLALPCGAAGCVRTCDKFSDVELLRQKPGGNWLMVSGVPVGNGGTLDSALETAVGGDYRTASRTLQQLDGAFAAVLWDSINRRLVIVGDFLGMQPLYIRRHGEIILIASEIKGISASGLFEVKMDPAGWGSFLSFGHTIGNATLVEGVYRVEPGSVLVYNADDGSFTTESYWRWPEPKPDLTFARLDTDELLDCLGQSIEAYNEHYQPATVLMSGGFDSRIILALLKERQCDANVLIVSHNDEMSGLDGELALKTAKAYGINAEIMSSAKSFYSSSAYLDYVIMNEVMTPSLYLFISQLASFLISDMYGVWEGVAPGCILAPLHQSETNFNSYLERECRWLNSSVWRGAKEVFGDAGYRRMHEAFSELLEKEIGKYPDTGFGVSEFVVRNRTRNRTTTNPLQVYSNYVLPFTPGLSRTFWEPAAAIPYELKADQKLYMKIFKRHFPEAAAIPFLSANRLYLNGTADMEWKVRSAINRIRRSRPVKGAEKIKNKLFRGSWNYWNDSVLVPQVISQIEAEHPDLNSDNVSKLKKSRAGIYKSVNYTAKELLFYWQLWRQIIDD